MLYLQWLVDLLPPFFCSKLDGFQTKAKCGNAASKNTLSPLQQILVGTAGYALMRNALYWLRRKLPVPNVQASLKINFGFNSFSFFC